MNIPYNMWHIWIGPNPAPTTWMNTWKEKHPAWNYTVIDNTFLKNYEFKNQHLIDEYYSREKYNGVADLIRYEILLNEGGFLPPGDAICYHNTEELFSLDTSYCYTVYENEIIRPGFVSPIYACNPGNKFVKCIVDTLHKLKPKQLSNKVFESTGNAFLKNMIEIYQPNIKIFPSHYFIPHHFKNKNIKYNGPDKVYANQMWGSTRHTYNNGL
jgi:mannosyltransferase OCH1-like enzyme